MCLHFDICVSWKINILVDIHTVVILIHSASQLNAFL